MSGLYQRKDGDTLDGQFHIPLPVAALVPDMWYMWKACRDQNGQFQRTSPDI